MSFSAQKCHFQNRRRPISDSKHMRNITIRHFDKIWLKGLTQDQNLQNNSKNKLPSYNKNIVLPLFPKLYLIVQARPSFAYMILTYWSIVLGICLELLFCKYKRACQLLGRGGTKPDSAQVWLSFARFFESSSLVRLISLWLVR